MGEIYFMRRINEQEVYFGLHDMGRSAWSVDVDFMCSEGYERLRKQVGRCLDKQSLTSNFSYTQDGEYPYSFKVDMPSLNGPFGITITPPSNNFEGSSFGFQSSFLATEEAVRDVGEHDSLCSMVYVSYGTMLGILGSSHRIPQHEFPSSDDIARGTAYLFKRYTRAYGSQVDAMLTYAKIDKLPIEPAWSMMLRKAKAFASIGDHSAIIYAGILDGELNRMSCAYNQNKDDKLLDDMISLRKGLEEISEKLGGSK